MIGNSLPQKQGLYDPQFEHDACGIGIVVNIKGKKSHEIVDQALTVLENLAHRGGSGSEDNSGDGAGILIQVPDTFFRNECPKFGIALPNEGDYGAGIVFLPQDDTRRKQAEDLIRKITEEEGQIFLGWRAFPVSSESLGKTAKSCMPFFKQVFIAKSSANLKNDEFERKLFIIRKRAEKETGCYIASLSSRTLVYKGMLLSHQVREFFTELQDPELKSALAMVHSRFSTNTFPSWERAHPNRYIIHNGEINTLRGNENWMYARQSKLKSELFGKDLERIFPIINSEGSDSAKFDNVLEFMTLAGTPLPLAVMMMIPEPWSKNETMTPEMKAFYEYQSCLMEAWDGPAAIGFTDGRLIGAVLDRNGLRPSRYYVTKDDLLILASEVGVLDIPPEDIICKERLRPGKMLLVDIDEGRIISDNEIKSKYAGANPYEKWIKENMIELEDLPEPAEKKAVEEVSLMKRLMAFGYTYEDLKTTIQPMASEGVDPIGAMGIDSPLAVLSEKPQLLYNYFKQLFAQVTNPPIDSIREEIVTGNETYIGSSGNLLLQIPENSRQIKLQTPIITDSELEKLKKVELEGFKSAVIHILYKPQDGAIGLERALNNMCIAADRAFESGKNIIILSDRGVNGQHAPIPALLAVSALHHHTVKNRRRTQISIVLESGEPREIHHFACLLGYGASAVNPYLAFESIADMAGHGLMGDVQYKVAVKKYIKCVTKGVVKILSKMGISTIKSYRGAQIFEAIGISNDLIGKYFKRTPSRIGGIGMPELAGEILQRHSKAFDERLEDELELESGGVHQWRKDGEYHLYNPETVFKLQQAVRSSDYSLFKEYSSLINSETQKLCTLRGLMKFKQSYSVPLEEVESATDICRRFKTGAMSYGSISQEAHEALAIAMNRLGGKSNTGEGGEDPSRFVRDENGDLRSSAIKQVASGRFGVTSHYLVNAEEIQIKMAQGAKPGEGGQLPGRKVYPWIARTRYSTPGVGLISPPPHHDIYSIEDLSELIHDLKNANRSARISVKLVSEVGVGTIAAGVAKGRADLIVISGYDGGTGASPRTSIKHAGLPWELGLAEAQQTLMMNDLRSRVILETDGKLMTGRDVAVAALLGAEEFGFATGPLVSLGCVMMRVCNLDTCPVGVATQNPALRARFCGKPEYVVNFMMFIAEELREIMAALGFRSLDEMVGRSDMLEMNEAVKHWKSKSLDFTDMLYNPSIPSDSPRIKSMSQDHCLRNSLDEQLLLNLCKPALEHGTKVSAELPIKNTDRVAGTILGSEISKKYGADGLPEDTIQLKFNGSAGQSFGAFLPKGITLLLEGDSNDYIGKGLSGGKIAVFPPKQCSFVPEENIIIGNVAFYGATSGEAYIRGTAGERFCVRNSGMTAVIESVGDHGCEYMTGGKVIILGHTGRNFAAGMSGGIAYVYDCDGTFKSRCNMEMIDLEKISRVSAECHELKALLENHLRYTESSSAKAILDNWDISMTRFVKVLPKDYKRMLLAINDSENSGLTGEEALLDAFNSIYNEKARSGGN